MFFGAFVDNFIGESKVGRVSGSMELLPYPQQLGGGWTKAVP